MSRQIYLVEMYSHHYKLIFFFGISLLVTVIKPIESSTWGTFKIAHVLDPDTEEGSTYYDWKEDEWVTWLHSRDELDKLERKGKRKKSLVSKGINSVIIASPEDIIDSFSGTLAVFDKVRKYFWSEDTFLIYTLKSTNRGTYDVFRCKNFYFVAALDDEKRPLHFHACGPQVSANHIGNYQFPWKSCVKVT